MIVYGDHLYRDLLTHGDDIGYRSDVRIVQLADVTEAVLAFLNFDECAEVLDARHAAFVDPADLNLLGHRRDLVRGALRAFGVHARNEHGAVVFDVDLSARVGLELLDALAARADDLADLFRVDLDGYQARSVFADLRPRLGDRSRHVIQNVQAALQGQRQRLRDDFVAQPAVLQVQLNAGDPRARPGNLEVHVAEMIFLAKNVGQQDVFVAVLHHPDRDAGHGGLDRHARVHEPQRPGADRRHRARTVRFENVAHNANGVGKVVRRREHGLEATLGQSAVADLAPPGAHDPPRLADREGREVVVQ